MATKTVLRKMRKGGSREVDLQIIRWRKRMRKKKLAIGRETAKSLGLDKPEVAEEPAIKNIFKFED